MYQSQCGDNASGIQPDLFDNDNKDAGLAQNGIDLLDLDKLFELSVQAYSAVVNARMDDSLDKSCLDFYIQKVLGAVQVFEAQSLSAPGRKKINVDGQLALRAAADRAAADRGDPLVRTVLDSAYRVGHEIHRLTGLLRFSPDKNGVWIARCAPDNSILPALAEHFTLRFGDDPWVIMDEKRGLALVRFKDADPCLGPLALFPFLSAPDIPDDEWEELWRSYHRIISIENRKNPALQLQLMPRRYWKYLPEIN